MIFATENASFPLNIYLKLYKYILSLLLIVELQRLLLD